MINTIALNCMVLGEPTDLAFVVEADPSKSIDHLKGLIKERRSDVLDGIASVRIILWKVDIPLGVPNRKLSALVKNPFARVDIELGGQKLRALQRIANVFSAETQDEVVNIIVERPMYDHPSEPPTPSPIATKQKRNPIDPPETDERTKKQRQVTPSTKIERDQDEETLVPFTQDRSRASSALSLERGARTKGLEYYYDAGRAATITPTWSVAKIDDINRVEKMFFSFQKMRELPEEWPVNGLAIDDCTAFMRLVADSGQGLLESKITKRYFLKLIRIFGDLVCLRS